MEEVTNSSFMIEKPNDKKNLVDLQTRMRSEWDRRIDHDYRYWMSDGVESDQLMWESGKRDLEILLKGLSKESLQTQVALEVGCGVGRLLRASANIFNRVIGIDVSQKALEQARDLLQDLSNVELILGNGTDLSAVNSSSVDFVYSFAALSSMPVSVFASYLRELDRIVKVGGLLRLQIYLGKTQNTVCEDSIAIRSFEPGCFVNAAEACGFRVQALEELTLPFSVSDYDAGLVASIVSLKKVSDTEVTLSQIERLLCPEGEKIADENWPGSETEYLMALARAKQHLEAGRVEEAEAASRYALECYQGSKEEVQEILGQRTDITVLSVPSSSGIFERNMEVIQRKFPSLFEKITQCPNSSSEYHITSSANGDPVVFFRGTALDHAEKPRQAAQVWAERVLASPLVKEAHALVVAGFASGYHLESLVELSRKPLHVLEPNIGTLKTLLTVRDCRAVLSTLQTISTTPAEFFTLLASDQTLQNGEFVEHPQTKAVALEAIAEFRRVFWGERGLRELRPSIAVVGPMYGGSLPIAGYVARALGHLNQRVHGIDVSSFRDGFSNIERYFRERRNTDLVQGQYVEMLSELVLQNVIEKKIDIVIALAQAPLTGRVLEEMRKRGIITVMWFVEDCRRFLGWKDLARYYDYMFLIQKGEFPQLVEQAGAGRAIYLPVGCDPEIHRPARLTAEENKRWGSQVSFVGAGYNNRRHVFATLAQRDFKIWGTEWPTFPPFDRLLQEQGRRLTPEEYTKIFNASTINLNLHSSTERDGVEPFGDFVNPRTFELQAAGAFQLVDNRELLPELFVPGKEVATFSSTEELHQRIDYYLQRPEERAAIVEAGRKRALTDHTYERRLQALLGYIYADKYRYLKERQQQSPWPAVLNASAEFPELRNRFDTVYKRGGETKLQELVDDIQIGKGSLSDVELKLLFLHHIKMQVTHVNKLRQQGE